VDEVAARQRNSRMPEQRTGAAALTRIGRACWGSERSEASTARQHRGRSGKRLRNERTEAHKAGL